MWIPARVSFGFKVLAGVEASLHGSSLLVGLERACRCRGGWRHEPGVGGAPIWGEPFLGDPLDEATEKTGSAAALPMGGKKPFALADEAAWVRARLSEKPDITGRELLAELNQAVSR
jgi:hypothetical protein